MGVGAKGANEGRVTISDALFTSTQQRVLGLLFGQPERAFTVSELIGLARTGSGAVQRELQRLCASGLVSLRVESGRKLYQANERAPIFEELRSIVEKTTGVAGQLREALRPHAHRIRAAVLYGSVAKGTATATSDVDVLLVAEDLTLEEAFSILEPVERSLGRRVEPTIYTPEELARRTREGHPFVASVLAGPHAILLGSEDELTAR